MPSTDAIVFFAGALILAGASWFRPKRRTPDLVIDFAPVLDALGALRADLAALNSTATAREEGARNLIAMISTQIEQRAADGAAVVEASGEIRHSLSVYKDLVAVALDDIRKSMGRLADNDVRDALAVNVMNDQINWLRTLVDREYAFERANENPVAEGAIRAAEQREKGIDPAPAQRGGRRFSGMKRRDPKDQDRGTVPGQIGHAAALGTFDGEDKPRTAAEPVPGS